MIQAINRFILFYVQNWNAYSIYLTSSTIRHKLIFFNVNAFSIQIKILFEITYSYIYINFHR